MSDPIKRGPRPKHPTPWAEEGSPWRLVDTNGQTVIYLQQLHPFPDPNDLAALRHRVNGWHALCDLLVAERTRALDLEDQLREKHRVDDMTTAADLITLTEERDQLREVARVARLLVDMADEGCFGWQFARVEEAPPSFSNQACDKECDCIMCGLRSALGCNGLESK